MNNITTWDYFAGQALAGMYRNVNLMDYTKEGINCAAKSSAQLADAMLAERANRFPVEAEKPDLRNGWDAAPDWAKYRAMDENKNWYWYNKMPLISDSENIWGSIGDILSIPFHLKPIFDGPWRESLQMRPMVDQGGTE
jgi:hypothetical protein